MRGGPERTRSRSGWSAGSRRRSAAMFTVLGLAACGGGRDAPSAEPAGESPAIAVPDTLSDVSAGVEEDSAAPGDSATPGDSAPAHDSAAEDAGPPPMPGEGAPREFRLLLVNPHDHPARVFASAGAARVALDTVAAGDSTRVDVRVRADRILLEAEDETGAGLGSVELELVPDDINRWEIGPPPGPRVAVRGGRAAGVRPVRPPAGRRPLRAPKPRL